MRIVYIIILSFLISGEEKFNGDSAFIYIKEQCAFGPRFPGSKAHSDLVKYLHNHFEIYADSVQIFSDSISHPFTSEKIEIKNLLIKHNINAEERYLLMAHLILEIEQIRIII